jgi:hypothetical protein
MRGSLFMRRILLLLWLGILLVCNPLLMVGNGRILYTLYAYDSAEEEGLGWDREGCVEEEGVEVQGCC